MKKLIFATIVAITGWFNSQAQSMPVPERLNDYLVMVSQMEQPKAEFLMRQTMETLVKDPMKYRQMMELSERRFSDAADSLHNEGLYMVVLKHACENFVLSSAEKEKQRLLLEGAKKNMPGSIATDFDYVTTKDKAVHHLKDLQADNILIYFNNPDCLSCETVKERLANSELINQLVKEKKLIVLAIYPYEDGKLWKKTEYPSMMINGWNQSQQIEGNELYDLPTLPCFYLLDKEYKVLIKNEGSLKKVEAFLKNPKPAAAQPKAPAKPVEKPAAAKPELKPAPADDPHVALSDQMLNYIINDQGSELFNCLTDEMKEKAKPEAFNNILTQIEAQFGKYQNNEPWQIQTAQGTDAYISLLNFEKSQLGLVIVYDGNDKIKGIQIVPGQVIKR